MDNNGLSIGKLSKITGLTTSAINFYIRNKPFATFGSKARWFLWQQKHILKLLRNYPSALVIHHWFTSS